ncbi:MAG TPA: pentapeptide repeat-containing protein [Methanocorpusculum sp.]|nr:pentapeptide repeat-containing protein [Methanocorpusculum sp.]
MENKEAVLPNKCNTEQCSLIAHCAETGNLEEWNNRSSSAVVGCGELVGADFTGLSLNGINLIQSKITDTCFHNAHLDGALFEYSEGTHSSFFGADLPNSSFLGAKLRESDFRNTTLNGAVFTDADCSNAKFQIASLESAILKKAIFTDADFEKVNMKRVDARGAVFTNTNVNGGNLSHADLRNADFTKAKLTKCDMSSANCADALFKGANLSGADLSGSVLSGADFTFADLRGANLEGADISGANFEGADLTDACLQKCKGDGANFHSAILHMAKLNGAEILNAYFAEAVLVNAEISEADLRGGDFSLIAASNSNFYGTNLTDAVLREAVLTKAVLWKAILTDSDLTWANLKDADLSEVNLMGSDLSESYLDGAKIRHAVLLGSCFHLASVDGRTVVTDCLIDGNTDFTGVGLGGIRIDPRLHARLQRNIRKIWWDEWIQKRKLIEWFGKVGGKIPEMEPTPVHHKYVPRTGTAVERHHAARMKRQERNKFWKKEFNESVPKALLKGIAQIIESIFINLPVRLFWKTSDYGSKTFPIVLSFIVLNIIFTVIYMVLPILPGMDPLTSDILGTANPFQGFMHTTMIIFSVTDMATMNLSVIPMFCALCHVILGYFLLAALVTRFAIMFQSQNG